MGKKGDKLGASLMAADELTSQAEDTLEKANEAKEKADKYMKKIGKVGDATGIDVPGMEGLSTGSEEVCAVLEQSRT
eukprot:SAG11_NODE_22309_length_408_cov_1.000000_1_plen_76_part_10